MKGHSRRSLAMSGRLAGILAVALFCALMGPAQALAVSTTGNNFTMLDGNGNPVGGTNDVVFDWDGTLNTAVAGAVNNASLSSVTTFFGLNWNAHDVTVYGPGTYTVYAGCAPGDAACGTGTALAFTVGVGQVGAHMLFDWPTGAGNNIDVVNVWAPDVSWNATNAPFPFFAGPTNTVGNTGDTVFGLLSINFDGAGDPAPGHGMVDGAFIGFHANFNVNAPVFAVCGDGTIDAGEQCDDGNILNGDCCSSTCQYETAGSSCTDGDFCNGEETCDGAGSCDAGTNPCADNVACTANDCDEINNVCLNTPIDANCDNGLYCDGAETCDGTLGCLDAPDPCPAGTVCNDTADICEEVVACGNGIVEAGEECDDGNQLDGDCCSANCTYEVAGSLCSDGNFCNGDDTCNALGECLAGVTNPCNDGVDCTVDACDEVNDSCDNVASNLACDDGIYCNGAETCDPVADCLQGVPVDCNDGVDCTIDSCNEDTNSCDNMADDTACADNGFFCDGAEYCDEVGGCSSTGNPCGPGTQCDDATNTCDEVIGCGNGVLEVGEECDDGNLNDGDCCSSNCTYEVAGSLCEDGDWCSEPDACDGAGTCQAGQQKDCSDGIDCTVDSCDEVNDGCVNTPMDNVCSDNGMFCDGQEVCDAVYGCVSTGDPCPGFCNEDTDSCYTGDDKVTVCHVPGGNPGNAHNISIAVSAVEAHLAHGDYPGPCVNAVPVVKATQKGGKKK